MANKTVYPFGTVGQLPSSIGVINDLKTGGADKALSAEMGKEIGKVLFPIKEVEVDISSLATHSYSLASNKQWRFGNVGKHKALPVQEGDVFLITPSIYGNFYGFVTENYSPPTSEYSTVPYVQGCDRVWVEKDTETQITAPSGAAYLILVTINGDNYSSTWSVTQLIQGNLEQKFEDLQKEDEKLLDIIAKPQVSSSDDYTKRNMSLGVNKKWINPNNCNHIILPCTEGDIFDIEVTQSTNTGAFYGLLKSYSTPINGADIPYVDDTDRVWIKLETPTRIVVPSGSNFLCLSTRDGDGNDNTWSIIYRNTNAVTTINNTLKLSNNGFTPSSYIPIKESYESYMSMSGQGYAQGSTIYGNNFFQAFSVENKKIKIYNLTTKQLIQEVSLPNFSNPRYHSNTISFSGTKYSQDDEFPLLYICSGYTDTTSDTTSEVFVIRITGTAGSFNATLIQTITIDFGIVNKWTEFVCDPINNRAWILGSNIATLICVSIPSISETSVTINSSTTVLDKFDYLESNFMHIGMSIKSSGQGMFFYHNRIYRVHGVPSYDGEGVDALYITVINTLTHCIEALVPLKNFGLVSGNDNTFEPEGCFVWGDEFYVAYRTFIAKLIQ